MGYLRGTPAIKSSVSLTGTDSGHAAEYRKSTKDKVHLELKHISALDDDYLKQNIASLDTSNYVARRRMFEVNGDQLDHWQKDNFESKRDATCRIVYEPKMGRRFFQKTLLEDYVITRGLVASLEQPYLSKYNRFFPKKGHFCCKACGNPLYTSDVKFDVDDGWPAFGACVLGSIGVTPIEERMAQIEKDEQACTKIQAIIRGHQCRNRVKKLLDELIEQLLRRKHGYESSENGEHDDWSTEGYMSSEFSWSSSSDESDDSKKCSNGGYVLSRDFGDDYTEIHCYRCKSHLGDVIAQESTGRNGEAYRERHRVNGRALKYMDEDLPRNTIGNSSLLFANTSQRRRLGLPDFQANEGPSLPFGTLHWLRKTSSSLSVGENHEDVTLELDLVSRNENNVQTLPFDSKISLHKRSSDPLGISNHRKVVWSRRKTSDPLSVSCHANLPTGNIYNKRSPTTKIKLFSMTSKSMKEKTVYRRRPMRRGSTDTSFSITELAARMENQLTFFIPDR